MKKTIKLKSLLESMEEGSPAFDYAALQAKKHHQKSFKLAGKEFPVKEEATTVKRNDVPGGSNTKAKHMGFLANTPAGEKLETAVFGLLDKHKASESDILTLVKEAFVKYKTEY